MIQRPTVTDVITVTLCAILVLGALTYFFLKSDAGWLTAILISTMVGGTIFSGLISSFEDERDIDGLPRRFIPKVWLVAVIFFTLLWAILTLLEIEVR